MSKKTKRLLGLVAVLALIAGFAIPTYSNIAREQQEKREEEKRMEKLYQHGFRLLEEQIATYIVEHYSGVSKVEFSPIFVSGGGSQSFLNLDVVPVVYDNYGNRALLSGDTSEGNYPAYGNSGDLYALELNDYGEEIITLKRSAEGGWIDVSNQTQLPTQAKLSSHDIIDDILKVHNKDGKLKGLEKNESGSPEASISYNLDIKKGKYWKWN